MRRVRFGPFEVNFETGELQKHGLRVKLQEKPLRVLQALVERRGELVTREELRNRLWPKDLYVDFERNLTIAMNKLRTALRDSADGPRYIETLPRRGYRFFAAVEEIRPEPVASTQQSESLSPVSPPEPDLRTPAENATAPAHAEWKWNRLVLAICIPVLLVASVVMLVVRANRPFTGESLPPAQAQVRLAVLPFTNLSGDEQQDYLCDGLTEEMITNLSRVSPGNLDVIARTSAMQYKNTRKSVQEIGRDLNVSYLLESSVRSTGDRVRVTTQLVRTSDAGHVWTGVYDRDLKDVLQLQQEIAATIAGEVKVSLAPQATVARRSPREVNPEAFRNYLLGRYHWNRRTPADLIKSRQYFREAVRIDPSFALGYSALADSLFFFGGEGVDAKTKEAARKAIDLDPTLGEPHAALAFIALRKDWEFEVSQREFRQAIQLSPNYATAHHWYAFYLANTGRLPEAIKELQRAVEIDPLSLIIRGALAEALSEAGRNDEALAEVRKILEMDAGFARGHLTLAAVYEQKGMFKEAIAEIRKAQELGLPSEEAISRLGVLHARAGDRAEAEKAIRELEREAKLAHAPPPAGALAMIYLAIGDREQSLAWLQKGRELRDEDLLDLVWSRNCVPLRSDARFQALVKSMNFPE